jgi:hypothetical protein
MLPPNPGGSVGMLNNRESRRKSMPLSVARTVARDQPAEPGPRDLVPLGDSGCRHPLSRGMANEQRRASPTRHAMPRRIWSCPE